MIYIIILLILILLLLKTINFECKKNQENFQSNSENGYISYKEQKEISSKINGKNLTDDKKGLRYRWFNRYKINDNEKDNQQVIPRDEIITKNENNLKKFNKDKSDGILANIERCQPSDYKEHIDIGAKYDKNLDKFFEFNHFINNGKEKIPLLDFPDEVANKKFSKELDIEIGNNNKGKKEVAGSFKKEKEEEVKKNLGYPENVKTINDYFNHQLSKKNNIYEKIPYKNEKTDDLRFFNNDSEKDDTHNFILEDDVRYNDLFGEPYKWQDTTFSELVSRGYPIDDNFDIGYENNNPDVKELTQQDKHTSVICKSCPIGLTQNYTLLGSDEEKGMEYYGVMPGSLEIDRFRKKYFHELAGSYPSYNEKLQGNNCKICDYPAGCFNPDADRRDMYETQSCRNGKNRVCSKCDSCLKGEEFIQTFCGEGTNANTKCQKCTPCPEGTYKVFGCDKDDTSTDNVCIKMTNCRGKPGKDDDYEDPGNGNYYYKIKDGFRGGNGYDDKIDKLGSYLITDLIRERVKIHIFTFKVNNKELGKEHIYGDNRVETENTYFIDLKDLNKYEQKSPFVNEKVKKNKDMFPFVKKSFYEQYFKKINNFDRNFIINFNFCIEFDRHKNLRQTKILSINNYGELIFQNIEENKFIVVFKIGSKTLKSKPLRIENIEEEKHIKKLRKNEKIYKTINLNIALVRSENEIYLFTNRGTNRMFFEDSKNISSSSSNNPKVELNKIQEPLHIKLFDITYYKVNNLEYFNDYIKNNKLPDQLEKVIKYNIYESNKNINTRQKSHKKNNDGENENIPNPYFGKDRECSKCDTCPPGFNLLAGCSGLNNSYNAICQRKINFEDYKYKDVSHLIPKGSYYSNAKLKIEIDKLNQKLLEQDTKIRNNKFGVTISNGVINKKEGNFIDIKFINEAKYYDPVPILSDKDVAKLGTSICSKSRKDQLLNNLKFKNEKEKLQKDNKLDEQEKIFYRNPNNPGCKGTFDTNFIPHSKCREDGTERLIARGTLTEDTKCGECKCPLGTVGLRPKCTGTFADLDGVEGCVGETKCEGDKKNKQIYYDKPGEYRDYTRDNTCKKCKKQCPPGTFKLHDCKPGTSNDTICKPHRECDTGTKENPGTMIIARAGTSDRDTVCQCIDGYDWPTDEITGEKDFEAPKCEKIKGECYTNPCHPQANCYDNFDEGTGKFLDYVCRCDNSEGWVETEMRGRGPEGCIRLPNKHSHGIEEIKKDKKSDKQKELEKNYPDIDPSLFKVKNHLETDYHRNRGGAGNHIHKTYY